MTAVKLTWTVGDVPMAALLADDYVWQMIERDDTPFVEISRATTRVPLRLEANDYVWSDPAGDIAKAYRISFVKDDGTVNPVPLLAVNAAADAYCTVAQLRDEGLTVAQASDARVELAIDWATDYIERYTRRFFVPRYQKKIFSAEGNGDIVVLGDIPIIALLAISIDSMVLTELDVIEVFNRHLRAEQIDDRGSSKLGISDDVIYDDDGNRVDWNWYAPGVQNIEVSGIWGYTELARGATPGETVAGSQVPIDYGETPSLINWAARMLTLQRVWPMAGATASMVAGAASLKRLKTRDQEIEWDRGDAVSGAAGSFASDAAIHEVLEGFRRSITFQAV